MHCLQYRLTTTNLTSFINLTDYKWIFGTRNHDIVVMNSYIVTSILTKELMSKNLFSKVTETYFFIMYVL